MKKSTAWILIGGVIVLCAAAVLMMERSAPPTATGEDAVTSSSASDPSTGVRALLVEGVAYAEIEDWDRARELFAQVASRAPDEPAALYNLAVAHFRLGQRSEARQHLTALPSELPQQLAGRVHYLRGRLAYEEGAIEDERAAYLAAQQEHPDEVAYLYALAELCKRWPEDAAEERGAWLRKALDQWPENARLASDYAMWAMSRDSLELRQRGLAMLEHWLGVATADDLASFLDQGREELLRGGSSTLPVPLRQTFNLLLGTKVFQSSSAALEKRLQVVPVGELFGPRAERGAPSQPSIAWSEAPRLLPAPILEEGERIVDMALVDDADDEAPGRVREAGLALLGERSLHFLPADGETWQKLGEVAAGERVLVGELSDDALMELIVLTADGVRLWQRDAAGVWQEPALDRELAAVGSLRDAVLVDFEHDGDLDLLAIDAAGRLLLVTHRGEAGWGTPTPLDVEGEPRCLATADLDGDDDQDLIIGSKDALVVLRNWRQGELAPPRRYPLPEPPERLWVVADLNDDALADLLVASPSGLSLWRTKGDAVLEPDPRSEAVLSELGGLSSPRQVAMADIDLDGHHDLLVAGKDDQPAFLRLRNTGEGSFEKAPEAVPVTGGARGLLPIDLDGDRDFDVVSWSADGLRVLAGQGAEGQRSLVLRLRAPKGKVPLDARGVRLQTAFGERVAWSEPRRPNQILGFGDETPTLVKAVWPNGIKEYLFEPSTGAVHTLTLTLRVEGSCPFLYAGDGQGMRFVTDLLGLSPLGMLIAPGRHVAPDPEEYVRLPDWVEEHEGRVELRITEELREVTYLDQVELVVVDAPGDVAIYNGEQWSTAPVAGLDLRLLTPLEPALRVRDHDGVDVSEVVRHEDQRYLRPTTHPRRYQGAMAAHRLTVELPPEVAAERPALVLIGWLHWGNTSTNLARSQDPDGAPLFPVLEVGDGRGGWRETSVVVGLPAGKTKPVVVDLSGSLDPADPRIRLTTDFAVFWDRIAVASALPAEAVSHRVARLAPQTARLRFSGFSRWFRASDDGPYVFDYGDRRPYPWRFDAAGREVPLAWQELTGFYTAYGPVGELLHTADDRYVVFGSGEEVVLRFDTSALPPLAEGWQRRFFLHSEGWEKDGDPNVSCSQTVEPLPWRAMTADPCSASMQAAEPGVGGPRTRFVAADRLARRVERWARPEAAPRR